MHLQVLSSYNYVHLFQVYVNRKLAPNTSYTLSLINLGGVETNATINGESTSLVTLTGNNIRIQLAFFNGNLLIGGYQYKSEVKVEITFFLIEVEL